MSARFFLCVFAVLMFAAEGVYLNVENIARCLQQYCCLLSVTGSTVHTALELLSRYQSKYPYSQPDAQQVAGSKRISHPSRFQLDPSSIERETDCCGLCGVWLVLCRCTGAQQCLTMYFYQAPTIQPDFYF